jgi:hypothetical protein
MIDINHTVIYYTVDMFSKVKAIINSLRLGHSSHVQTPSIDESIIINPQRIEFNEEDVTIVWLGKDAKSPEVQLFIGSLRTINDYIQVKWLDEYLFFFNRLF